MEFKVIHIDETDSTNGWLRENIRTFSPLSPSDGSPDSGEQAVTVVADYQTAGRGCGTNTWESERGKNLTFSMLIHPKDIPARQWEDRWDADREPVAG